MENKDLIASIQELRIEKKLDNVTFMVILEEVFRNALKKRYGSDENFDIIINLDKGDMEIYRNRTVVNDGEVEDENSEISLSEARKIEPDFEVDEDVSEPVKLMSLGRRAILALRQNLISKIQEVDNNNLFKKFHDLVGTIYQAEVHHVRPKVIILQDQEKNEFVLPKEKQIPTDYFKKGEVVRGIIDSVELKGNKTQVIMSRVSDLFLERLFEQEIPEIADEHIFIKKVVRIPGEKAKVAVETFDSRIDAVGACVGVKGSRIHGIVRELRNENIDVINYSEDPKEFIRRSLGPAVVSSIEINDETKKAEVFLKIDEVSKAIGRGGQNIKLAGLLTGYDIDVIREGANIIEEDDVALVEFKDEIEEWVIDEFLKIGLETARDVLKLKVEELVRRTDLEEETVVEVVEILSKELEG
nr:transcription termination factor NusA [uncultured Flavobacterium sp.]